jgi:hypothetical protein
MFKFAFSSKINPGKTDPKTEKCKRGGEKEGKRSLGRAPFLPPHNPHPRIHQDHQARHSLFWVSPVEAPRPHNIQWAPLSIQPILLTSICLARLAPTSDTSWSMASPSLWSVPPCHPAPHPQSLISSTRPSNLRMMILQPMPLSSRICTPAPSKFCTVFAFPRHPALSSHSSLNYPWSAAQRTPPPLTCSFTLWTSNPPMVTSTRTSDSSREQFGTRCT